MEAIILAGGKQYQVKKGQKISVNKLVAVDGQAVEFDVLAVVEGDKLRVGTPLVSGTKVVGKVLRQYKDEKVIVGTFKRRKGFHKKKGHRQLLTELEIQDIKG